MRNLILRLAMAAAALPVWPQTPQKDIVLRAMEDELIRSRQLRLAGQDAPYYIEYALDEAHNFSASATLGGLLSARSYRFRLPRLAVRVGSHEFDNSNSVFSSYSPGVRYDSDRWPLDDDYNLLRQMLWLGTDRAYKGAVQAIAAKRAALKNLTQGERLNDFAKATPAVRILEAKIEPVEEKLWTHRVRSMSGIFSQYPRIISSSVEVEILQSVAYFADSEGSMARYPDRIASVRARASAFADDGATIRDAVTFHAFEANRLAPLAEMQRAIHALAANVTALSSAPTGETYVGPVLFEPQAAAQILAEVLGGNLVFPRAPVSDPSRPVPIPASEFEGRIGARVLPEWLDVTDDATGTEWRGRTLMGHYVVDMEGQPPQPLKIVEQGVLRNVLLTRQPVRGFEGSNGRARLGGNFGGKTACISNLFVTPRQSVPAAELKAKLVDAVKARNKPYGLVIRKMDYPSSASFAELQRYVGSFAQSGSTTRPVSLPALVYRVYPDGREELVRGLRLRNFSVRSLRDITAASSDLVAYDYIANSAPFSLMGAGGYIVPVTVVAPGLLFDELDLDRPQEERPLLPIVPPPPLIPEK